MPWLAVLRLTGLLCAAGLAASRLGLLLHELLGHGGFAVAQGGEITDLRLFWFAGGWISYSAIDDPSAAGALATSMGGLIVELVVGGALWLGLANKPETLGIRVVRGIGAAIVAHACWYFATGTWHGYGDGLPAHRGLGDARYPIAIVAGLVTCGVAYACARLVLGVFTAVLPSRKVAGVAIAMTIAAVVLALPAVIEMQLRSDHRYGAIMKREGDRLADRELARWRRELARTRTAIDPALLEAETTRLRSQHREPPFMPVLGVLVLVSIAVGARRARDATGVVLTRRHLVIAAIVAAGSLISVIAIDAAFA